LLRKLSNNSPNEDYIFFCVRFFQCIVGKSAYNAGWNAHKKLSEIATPSDEALALLFLENNEARWSQEFDLDETATEEMKASLPKAKYTSSGRNGSMKGFTKKFGGWSAKGIERFNELLKLVKADRSVNGEWFDNILLERSRDMDQKDSDGDGSDFITADNDLFDHVNLNRDTEFCLDLGLEDGSDSDDDGYDQKVDLEDELNIMAVDRHEI